MGLRVVAIQMDGFCEWRVYITWICEAPATSPVCVGDQTVGHRRCVLLGGPAMQSMDHAALCRGVIPIQTVRPWEIRGNWAQGQRGTARRHPCQANGSLRSNRCASDWKYTLIISHSTLHVWNISLHWPPKPSQCEHMWHTWSVWVCLEDTGVLSICCTRLFRSWEWPLEFADVGGSWTVLKENHWFVSLF